MEQIFVIPLKSFSDSPECLGGSFKRVSLCYPKVYKQQMLERVWRKGNPLTLLVGMQTSTAAMENSVEI